MQDKVFGILQRVGRSFMLPIAILPVAGLLLGIGSSFTNETMLKTYGLMNIIGPGTFLNVIFQVMSKAGDIVFANLPILFAMGVAIGMAKKEKEVAALSAAIAFFIMHAAISAMITVHGGEESMLEGATTSVVGITSLQMGVFGGILVGLGVAALHNRFYKIQLPQVLSFFGGTRFVPIISALTYTVVGILMFYIWPTVQSGIYKVGDVVLNSGYIGTWVYGLMERLLIPFGLHHVFYLPFWQTAVGGTLVVKGQLVEGAQNIFFAQLADPMVKQFTVSATRFMSGKFPLMIFGLPGAAYAMYKTAEEEKRQTVFGLLLSAALTSMLTGITEPLEFTFIFVAPLLYGIHCVFAGFAYMLMHICNVGVGMTFSGGLIDLFLFGILQGNAKTNWIWIVIIGILYFIVYYVLFRFLIVKLDLKTPGREDSDEVKLYRRSDIEAKKQGITNSIAENKNEISAMICQGLGGKSNISDVDCCATRLRCTVFDASIVNESVLKNSGASGVVKKGNGVQIIYGPKVTVIKSELEDYLEQETEEYMTDKTMIDETDSTKFNETQNDFSNKTFVKQSIIVPSPITGNVADLRTAPDEAFASGMMGEGVVITPIDATIYAPEDCEIGFVFDTKHAIVYKTKDNLNILIHVGIDTVSLKGKGFDVFVKNGDILKKGDKLMEVDLGYIKKNAPSIATPVLCIELQPNQKIRMLKEGKIRVGEPLFAIDIYE